MVGPAVRSNSAFRRGPSPRTDTARTFQNYGNAMNDEAKSRKQLIGELKQLRSEMAALRVLQGNAAESAAESLRNQAMLLDLAHDAILVRDIARDGNIVFWNRGAEATYGWTKEEALGKVSHRLLQSRFPVPLEAIKDQLYAEGQWEGEITQARRNGAQIVVASRWALLRDQEGRPKAFLEINRDITKRKLAEDALRMSEERFRRTFDESPFGAAIIGLDRRIERANEALCRITGYSPEELMSRTFSDITHPEDKNLDQEYSSSLIAGDIEQYKLEERCIRKDGSIIWINLHVRLVRDLLGLPHHFIPMVEDITERKRSENELKLYAERLERTNRELQEFIFVASHDLQEPLRKIQVFSDRLMNRYRSAFDEQGKDDLLRLEHSANRMQDLILDLLKYSGVALSHELMSEFDLGELARLAAKEMEAELEEAEGTVEIGELPSAEVEPGQIRLLFQHLVRNALKFRGSGRPVVRISSPGCTRGICSIFVEDNGIGFDEKYVERIFRPFQRLHGHGEYEGTGMGLAICRKIVEKHGGSITARSTPGRGSTFIVNLPGRFTAAKHS